MRDAYVPWPRFDRRTLLLLLDDQQRLLLCGSCCRGWTVPEIRLGSNTDFLGEANRFLTERFGLPDPAVGPLWAAPDRPPGKLAIRPHHSIPRLHREGQRHAVRDLAGGRTLPYSLGTAGAEAPQEGNLARRSRPACYRLHRGMAARRSARAVIEGLNTRDLIKLGRPAEVRLGHTCGLPANITSAVAAEAAIESCRLGSHGDRVCQEIEVSLAVSVGVAGRLSEDI